MGSVLKPVDSSGWHRSSPLAVLFFLGKTVQGFAKNATQGLAPLIAFLVAYKGDMGSKLMLAAIGLAVIIVVYSILSYWFFRFQLRDDSILIRHGVLKKKQLVIKFDRIQGVNIQQNIVFRYFGLVTVSFDTAGSSGDEGNLPAVTREYAESLRSRIGKQRVNTDDDDSHETVVSAPLVRLDWRDMIRIGLSDRRVLVLFALIGPLIEQFEDTLGPVMEQYAEAMFEAGFRFDTISGIGIGAAAFVTLMLLFGLLSSGAALLRYHNFELFLDGSTLRSHGGLLTRHEHSMDLAKIQTLRLEQGIVLRWLGRFKLTARQATSGGRRRKQKMFTIPIVTAVMADELRVRFSSPEAGTLTQNPTSERFRAISPFYMRSRILYLALLPAIAATLLFSLQAGIGSLVFLLWIPAASLVTYRSWRRAGYLHDDEEFVRRSGILGYRTVAFLFRKVQRVTVSQSRYQRRKNLASVRVYLASGSVRIPYIDLATATQLRDYILFKVESSQRKWH